MMMEAKQLRRRVKTLEVSGFRAFQIKQHFDFKADVVLITGPNGVGKTSLADALNIALNFPAVDNRIWIDRGELRDVWRTAEERFVLLNAESRISPQNLKAPESLRMVQIPLAAFASVFYQADPSVDLVDYAQRAKGNAPHWIDGIRSKLEEARGAIEKEIDEYRPRNVPSEATEIQQRKTWAHSIKDALENMGGEFANDALKECLPTKGSRGGKWRSKLADRAGLPKVEPNIALDAIAEGFREERSKRKREQATSIEAPRKAIAWPVTPGRDPLCHFLGPGDSLPIAFNSAEGEQWIIPLQARNLARDLRNQAAKKRDHAQASQVANQKLAGAIDRLTPHTGRNFAERLVALAEEASSWLAAAHAVEVQLPKHLREVGEKLDWLREELASEAQELRKSIEARIAERHKEHARSIEAIREAERIEAAVAFGESISEDEIALGILRKGRSIRLSELRNAYQRQIGEIHGEAKTNKLPDDPTKPLSDLIEAVEQWAKFERQAEEWNTQRRNAAALGAAEKAAKPYLNAVDAFLSKRNSLLDAPPLSAIDLGRLSTLANQILLTTALGAKWKIELQTSTKGVALRFVSPNDGNLRVDMPNLSTGQKTLACLALALAFNLLTEGIIQHEVIVLDDIGTALDLAQLPAFAFILRALAYAPEGSPRRQIVLASHHEDMTDRFIDLLAPPPGEKHSLLVHAFEEWTHEEGPSIATYAFRDTPAKESLDENATKEIFASLVTKGVEWLERRY